jgi:hypothetical protein
MNWKLLEAILIYYTALLFTVSKKNPNSKADANPQLLPMPVSICPNPNASFLSIFSL